MTKMTSEKTLSENLAKSSGEGGGGCAQITMNALYAVLSFSTSGRFMKVVATFHPGSNSANISHI